MKNHPKHPSTRAPDEPPKETKSPAATPVPPSPAKEPSPPPAEPDAVALKDRLLRLQADFDNYRKRTQRDQAENNQRAVESLALELLPVIDHFEMGLRNAEEHHAESPVIEGFRLVYDQFRAALAKSGVSGFESVGQPFDPGLHEAISHLPSADHPPDMVVAQTRRGYRMGDRLLRAAQVVVSSGPPPVAGES